MIKIYEYIVSFFYNNINKFFNFYKSYIYKFKNYIKIKLIENNLKKLY